MMIVPNILKYQLEGKCNFKISDSCCLEMKKKPIHLWEKQNNKNIAITGMRKEEGGTRQLIQGCIITDKNGKIVKFHPLLVVSNEWEDWLIKENNIKLCKLYYPPYNFVRTGCRGCPFSLTLNEDLKTMDLYLPNERKQCELIWKPVYDEYRRLGYRLDRIEQMKLF